MAMTKASLRADLKAAMSDAAGKLNDPADFDRCLDIATEAMALKRPLTKMGDLTLVADQAEYSGVPSDLVLAKTSPWGYTHSSRRTPWNQRSAGGPLPIINVFTGDSGRQFRLEPPPTQEQITLYGAKYPYYYYASHVLHEDTEAETTLRASDRRLVLLRALAEAMRQLAIKGHNKPVTLRGGQVEPVPKNSTPTAIYQALLREFEEAR